MYDTESIIRAVEFIGFLNQLAENSKNGIVPFSKITPENRHEYDDAIVYVDGSGSVPCDMDERDIIADRLVDENHDDMISGWGNILSEVCDGTVTAKVELPNEDGDEGAPYVSIRIDETETDIVVGDGRWCIV